MAELVHRVAGEHEGGGEQTRRRALPTVRGTPAHWLRRAPAQARACRPDRECRSWPPVHLRATPIIESRVTSAASCSSVMSVSSRGPLRQHQIAKFRGGVPDTEPRWFRAPRCRTPCSTPRGSVTDAGAVRCRLIPDRRQAQGRPRVAGAQRADDDVVDLRGVLDAPPCPRPAAPEKPNSLMAAVASVKQALLVRRIDPGARHHLGAVARPDLGLVGIHQRVERRGRDQPLLGEDGFERPHPDRLLRLRRPCVRFLHVIPWIAN